MAGFDCRSPRNFLRAPALSIADSREMRVICNILYLMIELIRRVDVKDSKRDVELRQNLTEELGMPVLGKTVLLSHLFDLFMKYASNNAPHFPLKKLLLLIWKTLLVRMVLVKFGLCLPFVSDSQPLHRCFDLVAFQFEKNWKMLQFLQNLLFVRFGFWFIGDSVTNSVPEIIRLFNVNRFPVVVWMISDR